MSKGDALRPDAVRYLSVNQYVYAGGIVIIARESGRQHNDRSLRQQALFIAEEAHDASRWATSIIRFSCRGVRTFSSAKRCLLRRHTSESSEPAISGKTS